MKKIMFGDDMANGEGGFAIVDQRKDSIVRSDKVMLIPGHKDWSALRADSRVHHDHVNGSWRKVTVGLADRERSIEQIKGDNTMGDVHNLGFGIYVEDYALHGAHEMVLNVVIRGESDDGPAQDSLPGAASAG
jgi:hypothetical protein